MVWIQHHTKPELCEHMNHSYEILQHRLQGPLYGPSSLPRVTLAFFPEPTHVLIHLVSRVARSLSSIKSAQMRPSLTTLSIKPPLTYFISLLCLLFPS